MTNHGSGRNDEPIGLTGQQAVQRPAASGQADATRGAPCEDRDRDERRRTRHATSCERAGLAAAAGARRPRAAGLQLPLVVAARRARSVFRAVDPDRWEACERNPVRLLQEASTEALQRAAADASLARARRARRGRGGRRPRSPAPDRRRRRGSPGRLLLRGVRGPRVDADLRGRPRRAGRRHRQGGVGSRAAVRRGRAHVPPRLLPPAHRPHRLAAGGTGSPPTPSARRRCASRPATTRAPLRVHVPIGEDVVAAAGLAHRRRAASRCCCSTPTCRRTRASRAGSPRACTTATRGRASRSTCCSAPAAPRRCGRSGIDPGVVHMNEGHAAFAAIELTRPPSSAARASRPRSRRSASARSSRRTRRCAAGNDTYPPDEVRARARPARGVARSRRRGDRPARAHAPRRRARAVRRDAVRAARQPHAPTA